METITNSMTLVFQYFLTAGLGLGLGLAITALPALLLYRYIKERMGLNG